MILLLILDIQRKRIMEKVLNEILKDAKIAYKVSIVLDNENLEESLLSIMGNTKLLLNEFQEKKSIDSSVKNESELELEEIKKIKKRVPLWLKRQHQRNYKILASFMSLSENNKNLISLSLLEKHSNLESTKEFSSHYSQMKIIAPKAHGKVFEEENGQVKLWKPIEDFVVNLFTTPLKHLNINTL